MDKILITSIGTRGDIEPFLNLAIQFEAKGYQIVCLFPENFRSLVKQYNFEFYSYGKQFLDLIESPEGKNLMSSGGVLKKIWSYFKLHSTFKNINQTFVAKQYETIQEINPDLIIYNGKVLLPFLLHVRTKIKSILVSPVPYLYHPTTSRAHIAFRLNFGSWFNLKTYQLADRGLLRSYLQVKNKFNETKSLTKNELKYAVRDRIVFYTISRRLFDKPIDWSENAIIGGYPFLSCKSEYSPDRNLEKFIARHGKILMVSFGSMVNSNPKKNTNILLSVMEELKIPAIINTADGGLTVPKAYNSDLFYFCSYIPYDWILPQVYAVLHHGGSGTTHMACFYGCPSLIIPHIIDQFMWNELIFEKGLGPKGPSINKMNTSVLLERIEDLYSNFTYKSNALFMAHKMHNEQFTFGDVSTQIMEHLRQTVPSLNKEQTSA